MFYVRHQSANGGSGSSWRYDAVRKVVLLTLQRSVLHIEVCAKSMPRFGAFQILRVDACTWRIDPVRYTSRNALCGVLVSEAHFIEESLGIEAITLLDATNNTAVELAELGRS